MLCSYINATTGTDQPKSLNGYATEAIDFLLVTSNIKACVYTIWLWFVLH